jgi:hypothetical protein
MRTSISAAFVGCTCAIVLLGGCGSPSLHTTTGGNQTGSASNHTSNQPGVSSPSGSAQSKLGTSSNSSQADGSQSGAPSQNSTVGTAYGQGMGGTTRSTEKFVNVATGSKLNQMQAKFAPTAWKQGEAALLVNPPNSYGLNGSLLYVLADSSRSGSGQAAARLLDEHAISAVFSPDGKWLAVQTQTNQGSVSQPAEASQLWLMSADGKQKYDLGDVSYVQGAWIGSQTFMYTDGTAHVYSVQPGGKPSTLPLQLPAGVTVNALKVNPKTKMVAIDEVVPDANGNIVDRHDVIGVWNPVTGHVINLVTAPTSDGFILGPWTSDGTKLFYWDDPMHSSSIAADGLQLRTLSMDGTTKGVAVTLTGMRAVKPIAGSSAVVQVGGSRYLFVKKTIQMWNGNKLVSLPGGSVAASNRTAGMSTSSGSANVSSQVANGTGQGSRASSPTANVPALSSYTSAQAANGTGEGFSASASGTSAGTSATTLAGAQLTQIWPTVNPAGTVVAYSQGPVLSMNAGQSSINQWWEHMQLVTVDVKTGAHTLLSSAGTGIVDPDFTSNGQYITYVSGSQLDVVPADGSSGKQIVFEAASTNAASYPQWSLSLPVEVVDYHP